MAGNEQARHDAVSNNANSIPSSINALMGVLAIMHGIFVLVAVVMVIRRRNLQPLKFRDPIMLVKYSIIIYLIAANMCLLLQIAGTVALFISDYMNNVWPDDCRLQWLTSMFTTILFVFVILMEIDLTFFFNLIQPYRNIY